MTQSPISTSVKGTGNFVITTKESCCLTSSERSSLASPSTVPMAIYNKDFSQKASLASAVTDMIFAALQLQEKWLKMQAHLYTTCVDFTKTFGTVNHEGLWKIVQQFGCLERSTHMKRKLHDGMMDRVTDNGPTSEAFTEISRAAYSPLPSPALCFLSC
ncbi:hypothetical protein SprV_0100450200 [Sparganum proliferum]